MNYRQDLISRVAQMYERYPYPHYPLLAQPVWREGYTASPHFASRLAREAIGIRPPAAMDSRHSILIAGSGEVLPYVISKWTGNQGPVTCLDLSQTNLRRARWRLRFQAGAVAFHRGDLDRFLDTQRLHYSHIDAYGVLHHLLNPRQTIDRLAKALLPGGTARFMVYNAKARRWIHELQGICRLLAVDPLRRPDLRWLRRLLWYLCDHSRVRELLRRNDAGLVDTLLHPREARLDIRDWYAAIDQAGLARVGLFDRYGELDDLPCPLWRCPTADQLEARAEDLRFEGNLELFLARPMADRKRMQGLNLSSAQPRRTAWSPPTLWSPPALWFSFSETKGISRWQRLQLWNLYQESLKGRRNNQNDQMGAVSRLTLPAKKRLARLGVLVPSNFPADAVGEIEAPLAERMAAVVPCSRVPRAHPVLLKMIAQRLRAVAPSHQQRRTACILKRRDRLWRQLPQ